MPASGSLLRSDLWSAEIRLKCSSPRLVVEQRAPLDGVAEQVAVDATWRPSRLAGARCRRVRGGIHARRVGPRFRGRRPARHGRGELQEVECHPRIAVGVLGHGSDGIIGRLESRAAETTLRIGERTAQEP